VNVDHPFFRAIRAALNLNGASVDWTRVLVAKMLCPGGVARTRENERMSVVLGRSRLPISRSRAVWPSILPDPPHMNGTRQNAASTTANPSTSRPPRSAAVKRDSLTAELERGSYSTKLSHIVVLTPSSQIRSSRLQSVNNVRTFSPRAWPMLLLSDSSSNPGVRK